MPPATHWKCHDCNAILLISIYPLCTMCGHRKCERCNNFAIKTRSLSQYDHGPSYQKRFDSLLRTSPPASVKSTSYTCCQCKDGPKLWELQPKCIKCDHVACKNCVKVKRQPS